MNQVDVHTNDHTYSVYIGNQLRFQTGDWLKRIGGAPISSILIVSDSMVAPLYLEDVMTSLGDFEQVHSMILPAGEQSKSFTEFERLTTEALSIGLDRKSVIIALGGGVVGDIAGFVAASYMRGIRFVQMPTTLLAHDSSVGGKVAINHPLGKNMIGAFHQPEMVIYDTDMLSSLSKREWRSGFAEVLKHGLILDHEFYEWLQSRVDGFTSIEDDLLAELLTRSISIKADVVSEDEQEQGIRALLNLGHTLGHAIEAVAGYGRVTHGEAVVIGIVFAMKLSEKVYGHELPIQAFKTWIKSLGYESDIPADLDRKQLLHAMKKDKKAESGKIRMILLKGIGEACVETVETDVILSLLEES